MGSSRHIMRILCVLMFVNAAWSASTSLRDCDYCHRNAARCKVGHVLQNTCVRCECSAERLYQCESVSRTCDANNVILGKPTEARCEAHMIYVHESVTCMCSKNGHWPHDKCGALFQTLHTPKHADKLKNLPADIKKTLATNFDAEIKKMVSTNYKISESDIKKVLATNYDPENSDGVGAGGLASNDIAAERESCEPDSYVVKDCNVCKCNAQGVMERCTRNDCSQAGRRDIRRAFGNVLGSCVPNNWYALAPCQFCYCQQTNKLVCSTRAKKHYKQVVSLGTYNLTDCGQDFIKELHDLNPTTHNNLLREGAMHTADKTAKVYVGETGKVYMGEPAKVYMGEPAKVYMGEPAKVYMGEPAKVYMPASGPAPVPVGHMGTPAEVYMPPSEHGGEPAEVYKGEPSQGGRPGRDGESLSVPANEHMGTPAEVYMGEPAEVYMGEPSPGGSPGRDGEPAEVYMPPPGRDGESLSVPASVHMGEREAAKVYMGEPAEVYMGEPAKVYTGEPAKVYTGEPAKVYMGEPAKVYMGEPAKVYMGEPAKVYKGEPAAGPTRVRVDEHMGEPAEVYMPAHRPVALMSAKHPTVPHDSNLKVSLQVKKPNEPKAEYETEYEDEPVSEVVQEQNTLSPFENEEESVEVEEENSSPSSYVRQPDGSYKPVYASESMRIPSHPQQPSVLNAMMTAQGMPKEMVQILSSMPEVSQMHSSLLSEAKAGKVNKYDVVVKQVKSGVTPSPDSHVLRVNLPQVLERIIQLALRKSMVKIDATQSCMPGTTSQEGCNFCYCLTNGKLLCTDKKTC